MTWYAYTPREGYWRFTADADPEKAKEKLRTALKFRRAMKYPIDNEILAKESPIPIDNGTQPADKG